MLKKITFMLKNVKRNISKSMLFLIPLYAGQCANKITENDCKKKLDCVSQCGSAILINNEKSLNEESLNYNQNTLIKNAVKFYTKYEHLMENCEDDIDFYKLRTDEKNDLGICTGVSFMTVYSSMLLDCSCKDDKFRDLYLKLLKINDNSEPYTPNDIKNIKKFLYDIHYYQEKAYFDSKGNQEDQTAYEVMLLKDESREDKLKTLCDLHGHGFSKEVFTDFLEKYFCNGHMLLCSETLKIKHTVSAYKDKKGNLFFYNSHYADGLYRQVLSSKCLVDMLFDEFDSKTLATDELFLSHINLFDIKILKLKDPKDEANENTICEYAPSSICATNDFNWDYVNIKYISDKCNMRILPTKVFGYIKRMEALEFLSIPAVNGKIDDIDCYTFVHKPHVLRGGIENLIIDYFLNFLMEYQVKKAISEKATKDELACIKKIGPTQNGAISLICDKYKNNPKMTSILLHTIGSRLDHYEILSNADLISKNCSKDVVETFRRVVDEIDLSLYYSKFAKYKR